MEERLYQTKENLLLKNLKEYFDKKNHYKTIFFQIINNSEPISLRVIDWFVTNYSKKNGKRIYTDIKFDIYNNYKSQLKAFNKKLFDPFCRTHKKDSISKFKYKYDEHHTALELNSSCTDSYIITTIGQLNFFRWAFENNVINYIVKFVDEIKIDIKDKSNKKRNDRDIFDDKNKNCEENFEREKDYSISF